MLYTFFSIRIRPRLTGAIHRICSVDSGVYSFLFFRTLFAYNFFFVRLFVRFCCLSEYMSCALCTVCTHTHTNAMCIQWWGGYQGKWRTWTSFPSYFPHRLLQKWEHVPSLLRFGIYLFYSLKVFFLFCLILHPQNTPYTSCVCGVHCTHTQIYRINGNICTFETTLRDGSKERSAICNDVKAPKHVIHFKSKLSPRISFSYFRFTFFSMRMYVFISMDERN